MQRTRKPENIRQEILEDRLFKESWINGLKQQSEIITQKMIKPKTRIEEQKQIQVSKKWFEDKIRNYFLGKDDPEIFGKQSYNGMNVKTFSSIFVGKIIYFHYNAKYKGELNQWDRYPLVLVYNQDPEHLYGLNFHYVPPDIRFTILRSLVNQVQFLPDDKAYFKATYRKMSRLSTIKYIKPCFKTYIKKLMTPPRIVKPKYWFNAIYLPNAQWVIRNYG